MRGRRARRLPSRLAMTPTSACWRPLTSSRARRCRHRKRGWRARKAGSGAAVNEDRRVWTAAGLFQVVLHDVGLRVARQMRADTRLQRPRLDAVRVAAALRRPSQPKMEAN